MEVLISRRALHSALAGARAAWPNEFLCLLIGRHEKDSIIVEDTMIPPGLMVSDYMSSFSDWMVPFVEGTVGTFHSHPSNSNRPSNEDLELFSQKGGANFIAREPFDEASVACYDARGKRLKFKAIS